MNKNKVLKPSDRFTLDLHSLWQYRDLFLLLSWRNVSVLYRQTLLGVLWAILQPVMTMIVFSVIFGQLADIPSDGIPYPIFSFAALLPWQLFATGLSRTSLSLVGNTNLISKVYFPRSIIPLAAIVPSIVDFLLAFIVLLGMMVFFQISVTSRILIVPIFIFLTIAASLSIGLSFSALNVQYRDIRYVLPFLSQFLMYLSPVVYPTSLVPGNWKLFYALNPMVGMIEGFRWALLGTEVDILPLVFVSSVVTFILLIIGLYYFQHVEKNFADII